MGIKSVLGIVTGATASATLARGVGSDLHRIGGHLTSIYEGATKQQAEAPALPGNDPAVRFREAMRRYRRTERDLVAMRRATAESAALMATLTVASVAAVAWLSATYPAENVLAGLARFAFPLIPAALALRAAFVNYCVRNGRLDSLGDFLKSGDFLPRR